MNIRPKTLILLPIILVTMITTVYASANTVESINSNEGYPYHLLLQRTEQVKLIYKGKDKITCHVEVKHKQQTWKGKVHTAQPKRFNQSPLAACMNRDLAKTILKSTFS